MDRRQLEGICIKRTCPIIHHLLFVDGYIFFIKVDALNATTLKKKLEQYSRTSSQNVNFQKSSIRFSSGIAATIQGSRDPDIGYRGSTPHRETPRDLYSIEPIKKRHWVSWKIEFCARFTYGRTSYNARREILIKLIIIFIPTYTMALFKLPKTWCGEMMVMITRFGRSQSVDERRIHWRKWDHMTKPKAKWGMGFRDMNTFNIYMLTKMAWRLNNNPEAYWAKVMKGIYFSKSSILEAKKGSRASWS